MLPPPPRSTLFPYTTLFRSIAGIAGPCSRCQNDAGWLVKLAPRRLRFLGGPGSGDRLRPAAATTEGRAGALRSEEHTSELQSRPHLVCRLLLEKKKKNENLP